MNKKYSFTAWNEQHEDCTGKLQCQKPSGRGWEGEGVSDMKVFRSLKAVSRPEHSTV